MVCDEFWTIMLFPSVANHLKPNRTDSTLRVEGCGKVDGVDICDENSITKIVAELPELQEYRNWKRFVAQVCNSTGTLESYIKFGLETICEQFQIIQSFLQPRIVYSTIYITFFFFFSVYIRMFSSYLTSIFFGGGGRKH